MTLSQIKYSRITRVASSKKYTPFLDPAPGAKSASNQAAGTKMQRTRRIEPRIFDKIILIQRLN